MQITLLPQKICHHIDKLSCNFLWGGSEQHKSCHTVSWHTVTLPKEVGGLGIPSTRHRNHAILMNQAWCLLSNPTSLWAQVLQAKYFPQDTLFNSPRTFQGSHIWTAFLIGAKLFCGGMRWIIGDGQTIQIWQDSWLPNGSLRNYIEGPLLPHEADRRVNALWTNHSWSFDSLNLLLPPYLYSLIQGIPVARFAHLTDTFLWPHNKGTCSVKFASTFLFHHHQVPWNKTVWNWMWSLPCPKKIQVFLWKAMRNRLPTKTFLSFGRQHVDSLYPHYHSLETTIHILRDCPQVREIWYQSPRILPLSFFCMPLQDWLRYNATLDRAIPHHIPWQVFLPFTCWKLWLTRNERIFKHQSRSQHNLLYSSVQATTEFHFLVGSINQTPSLIPQIIRWHTPPYPYLKLNTDGSALGNPSLACAGGVLRDHWDWWISSFSLHVGLATNNMAEMVAVRQGLEMAWNMGSKYLQLEMDSKVVLTWLTNTCVNYPTNMMPLICDCRNLLVLECSTCIVK